MVGGGQGERGRREGVLHFLFAGREYNPEGSDETLGYSG